MSIKRGRKGRKSLLGAIGTTIGAALAAGMFLTPNPGNAPMVQNQNQARVTQNQGQAVQNQTQRTTPARTQARQVNPGPMFDPIGPIGRMFLPPPPFMHLGTGAPRKTSRLKMKHQAKRKRSRKRKGRA